jgi:hypothetical protein
MSMLRAMRFFTVVPVVSKPMLAAFALATLCGSAAIAVEPGYGPRATAPVLLLQLFAASSGFLIPARRGHYDLLLTSGGGRLAIGVAHWTMSVFPGALAWLALAATERAAGGHALASSGTLAAMVMTSTLPWALSIPLSRMSGAVVWLLTCMTLAISVPVDDTHGLGLDRLLPWAMIGRDLHGIEAVSGAMIVIAGGASLLLSFNWIRGMHFPLESSQ